MALSTVAAPAGFSKSPGGVYAKRQQYERCALHGESSRVLNVLGNPYGKQNQFPSVYQSMPATADELLKWLGDGLSYPAGFGIANVLAIYDCSTPSPLTDSLGLGPNLVATGAPLTGRECVGLGQAGSFTSKVGVETVNDSAGRFVDAGNAFGNVPDGTIFSVLLVFRVNTGGVGAISRMVSKEVAPVWLMAQKLAGSLSFYGPGYVEANVVGPFSNASWNCAVGVVDCVGHVVRLLTNQGDAVSPGFAGGAVNAGSFCLGQITSTGPGYQAAYLVVVDREITSAMRANFWRHAALPIPYLHARNSPMIAPITASRVAAWGAGNVGQPCLGYDASLASAATGNAQGSGYMAEDGITFEPIGSTDWFANLLTLLAATASVDGPSGMRDGVRVTMAGGYGAGGPRAYGTAVVIAGASNVPWRYDLDYRRPPAGAVGTSAKAAMEFYNDPGGTETFVIVSDAATPVDWVRAGGACTPVGAAHTVFRIDIGATNNLDNCDFGEPAVVKNRTTAPLAWRRVGTAAAAATVTPAYEIVNAGNRYYFPLYGRFKLVIGNFQLTDGATFLQFGAFGSAGSLTLDYGAGPQLRLRIWDSAGLLALTILGGVLSSTRRIIQIDWDTTAPLHNIGGAYAAITVDGVVVGTWNAPWSACVADVTPLYFGSLTATHAARCLLELC